jgi:hypothetical protein
MQRHEKIMGKYLERKGDLFRRIRLYNVQYDRREKRRIKNSGAK